MHPLPHKPAKTSRNTLACISTEQLVPPPIHELLQQVAEAAAEAVDVTALVDIAQDASHPLREMLARLEPRLRGLCLLLPCADPSGSHLVQENVGNVRWLVGCVVPSERPNPGLLMMATVGCARLGELKMCMRAVH